MKALAPDLLLRYGFDRVVQIIIRRISMQERRRSIYYCRMFFGLLLSLLTCGSVIASPAAQTPLRINCGGDQLTFPDTGVWQDRVGIPFRDWAQTAPAFRAWPLAVHRGIAPPHFCEPHPASASRMDDVIPRLPPRTPRLPQVPSLPSSAARSLCGEMVPTHRWRSASPSAQTPSLRITR